MAELRTSSSDLAAARRTAQSLERGDAPAAEAAFPFRLSAVLKTEEERATPDVGPLPAGASWTRIVDHCLARTGAMGIVVVDESGFVVASAGHWRDWSEFHLEDVSARLIAALDQVERLEGPWGGCSSMALHLGDDALTGLRTTTGAGRLTFGLLASRPLPRGVLESLRAQLQEALGTGA